MRMFEAAILLSLLPAVLGMFVAGHRRPRWISLAPFVALGFAFLQLIAEGYRWQMAPAYALAVLLCFVSARAAGKGSPAAPAPWPWWRAIPRVTGALLLFFVLAAGAGLPLALPMFDLPKPTGAFGVGTTTLHMLDESRPETFTDDPNDKREVMVQAWYPAGNAAPGAEPQPFWGSDARQRAMAAQALGLPGFFYSHLARVPTHSHADAKVAGAGSYPALIFSHGYAQGFAAQNTVLMEELASHGYAVFSIGHPYESASVIYRDGHAVGISQARMERVREELSDKYTSELIDKIKASMDRSERRELVRDLIGRAPLLTASLHLWVADTKFVLDRLERLNDVGSNSLFEGRLDLSRVGVLGMSFGGAVAGQALLDDARIGAGVNLDGLQYGDLLERPLQKPFMFMHNPDVRTFNEPMYENAVGPAWYVVVAGATHFDFTDFPLVAPVFKLVGALGDVPAERMMHITNAYTLAFFDLHLKGKNSPLLKAAPPDYPEVSLSSKARIKGQI